MDEPTFERLVGDLYQGAINDAAGCRDVRGNDTDHREPGLGAVVRGKPQRTMSDL
jgi:hypothetical protein